MARVEAYVNITSGKQGNGAEVFYASSYALVCPNALTGGPDYHIGSGRSPDAAMDDLYIEIKDKLPEITFITEDFQRRIYPLSAGLEGKVMETVSIVVKMRPERGNQSEQGDILFKELNGKAIVLRGPQDDEITVGTYAGMDERIVRMTLAHYGYTVVEPETEKGVK